MSEQRLTQEALIEETEPADEIMKELETLALVRTRFSSERSLLSWMRTSASLYTFGFGIPKFFDFLQKNAGAASSPTGPRRLGLALICVGIVALLLALIQHVQRVRRAKELGLPVISRFSLPVSGASAMLAIGITLIIGVSLNWSFL